MHACAGPKDRRKPDIVGMRSTFGLDVLPCWARILLLAAGPRMTSADRGSQHVAHSVLSTATGDNPHV